MLVKKNYKQEEHFNQYYSAYFPRSNGKKLVVYYKRYKPKVGQSNNANLY